MIDLTFESILPTAGVVVRVWNFLDNKTFGRTGVEGNKETLKE